MKNKTFPEKKMTFERIKDLAPLVVFLASMILAKIAHAEEPAKELFSENQPKVTVRYEYKEEGGLPALIIGEPLSISELRREIAEAEAENPRAGSKSPIAQELEAPATQQNENKTRLQEIEEDIARGAEKVENIKKDLEGNLNIELKGSKILKGINTDSPTTETNIGLKPAKGEVFFNFTKRF